MVYGSIKYVLYNGPFDWENGRLEKLMYIQNKNKR